MIIYLILANIFSGLASLFLVGSTFCKSKKAIVKYQIIDASLCCVSNVLVGSFSALATNSLATLRNVLVYKNKLSRVGGSLLALILVCVGLYVNTKG